MAIIGRRISGAAQMLTTGKNPLQEKLDIVNQRNSELLGKYRDQKELLNGKLDVLRRQIKTKDEAICKLNERVGTLNEKLTVARDMISKKEKAIKGLAAKSH